MYRYFPPFFYVVFVVVILRATKRMLHWVYSTFRPKAVMIMGPLFAVVHFNNNDRTAIINVASDRYRLDVLRKKGAADEWKKVRTKRKKRKAPPTTNKWLIIIHLEPLEGGAAELSVVGLVKSLFRDLAMIRIHSRVESEAMGEKSHRLYLRTAGLERMGRYNGIVLVAAASSPAGWIK